jgi:hypothetical protein
MRLPESDKETVKVQPLPANRFFNSILEACTDTNGDEVIGHANRDLSKVSMFGCDSLECHGNPLDVPQFGLKFHIFEFPRFREVD